MKEKLFIPAVFFFLIGICLAVGLGAFYYYQLYGKKWSQLELWIKIVAIVFYVSIVFFLSVVGFLVGISIGYGRKNRNYELLRDPQTLDRKTFLGPKRQSPFRHPYREPGVLTYNRNIEKNNRWVDGNKI